MWTSYEQLPGMSGYYLEDSYVLSISQSDTALVFDLDVVLTERHPEFREPEAGEQYCYRRGHLVFEGFREIRWIRRTEHAFTDASGEVDYGNIDVLRYDEDGYALQGDWGEVYVAGGRCRIVLT